jgi:aspartate beta-hydroxylase
LYLSGLRAQPWWDPDAFPWTREIDAAFDDIRRDVVALIEDGELAPIPVANIPKAERRGDQLLIDGDRGGWDIRRLASFTTRIPEVCACCPATAALLDRIPGLTGTAGFGVMLPGTHLTAHCGNTKAKVRCHLGIDVPSGCRLRVGSETREWIQRGWLMFDDSFEHEVWHDGDRTRVVFILDVYHPDLTEAERAWVDNLTRTFKGLI